MSWSVYAQGKPAALAVHVKEKFEQSRKHLTIEPERNACDAAAKIVDDHLAFLAEVDPTREDRGRGISVSERTPRRH
jgi:hypothetical protein